MAGGLVARMDQELRQDPQLDLAMRRLVTSAWRPDGPVAEAAARAAVGAAVRRAAWLVARSALAGAGRRSASGFARVRRWLARARRMVLRAVAPARRAIDAADACFNRTRNGA